MQRYLCKSCGTKFQLTTRTHTATQTLSLWNSYVFGKQTLRELSEKTGIPKLTIKRRFDTLTLPSKIHSPRSISLVVDCTFFGKKETTQWGVMVFRDTKTGENIWWKFVDEECLSDYRYGHQLMKDLGYTITSVTCDGFRGLVGVFADVPTQFCHFHQKQIVRRYVTKNPRLEAGRDLKRSSGATWISTTKIIPSIPTGLQQSLQRLFE